MWGTGPSRWTTPTGSRIIPASVGNGVQTQPYERPSSDHPRECGGTGCVTARGCTVLRIIPASVGNGASHRVWLARSSGSSPRVWGTGRPPAPYPIETWIIPASVGNGSLARPVRCPTTDHPRECGERIRQCDHLDWLLGSSPRVWGTVLERALRFAGDGIIPASVGNGRTRCRSTTSTTDHPRECGERDDKAVELLGVLGSSPRVWGTGPRTGGIRRRWRIIPASVGNGDAGVPG